MPFDSYLNLKTTILQWLARPDDPLVRDSVPDMVQLFEAEAVRRLRVGMQENAVGLAVYAGQSALQLPADFNTMRSATVYTPDLLQGTELAYLPASQGTALWDQSGRPRFYTIYGNDQFGGGPWIELAPFADIAYIVIVNYLRKLPPLGDLAPSNWLLAQSPDLYLFGSLVEAEAFIGHDERIQIWLQRREAGFESIRTADLKSRWPGALQIRVDWGPTSTGGSAVVQMEEGMITGVFGENGIVGGGNNGTVVLSLDAPVSVARGGTGNLSLPNNTGAGWGLTGTLLRTDGTQLISHQQDEYGTIGFYGNLPGFYQVGTALSSGPFIEMMRCNGTLNAPLPITVGDPMGQLFFDGYDSTGTWSEGSTWIACAAAEDFTGTARGTHLSFATTALGTAPTEATERMFIRSGVVVGDPTGGDPGVGGLNAVVVKANNVTLTSDASLKADIESLPDCLALVTAIEPKQYRFVEPELPPVPLRPSRRPGAQQRQIAAQPVKREAGPSGFFEQKHWGFVAQDVQMALRDAGHDVAVVNGDDGAKTLGVGDMMAVLWKAVQELSAEVRELKEARG